MKNIADPNHFGNTAANNAAKACAALGSGWFLPSIEELRQLCLSSGTLGISSGSSFWSSSQYLNDGAWIQYFDGFQQDENKYVSGFHIRAIRAF